MWNWLHVSVTQLQRKYCRGSVSERDKLLFVCYFAWKKPYRWHLNSELTSWWNIQLRIFALCWRGDLLNFMWLECWDPERNWLLILFSRTCVTHIALRAKENITSSVGQGAQTREHKHKGITVTSLNFKPSDCILIVVVNHRINQILKFQFEFNSKFKAQICLWILIQILLWHRQSGQYENCSKCSNLPSVKNSHF
jgi:hypothetical protein